MKSLIEQEIGELYPGYFALVMATGIVSIAAHLQGMASVAWSLFLVNLAAYGVLWMLTLVRLVRYFPQIIADLADHSRGPGFFTCIAGTCVLGSQFVLLVHGLTAATILWTLGLGLWVLVMYAFLTAVIVRQNKPSLEEGINGAWLITTVATQSVSVLGALIAPGVGTWQEIILFFALVMYLVGCMLYLSIIALIFYRLTFLKLAPIAFTPPYWINMGAVAITTLAGATLVLAAPRWGFLQELLPFLKGFTLFFWATGTWWIPLLFILGVWRHLYRRLPLRYDPQYWGMVFPLGMYTTCTFQLARATDLAFLDLIPRYFVYLALAAWLATFAGLVQRLVSGLLPPLRTIPPSL